MPRFLEMLRAKNIFGGGNTGRRPLGMPDIDSGNVAAMFRSVVPLARSLKDDDMRRQKEMMEFENSLRNRPQPQSGVPVPPKPNVVFGGVHPPTEMQQRFRQDDLAKKAQADRMALQTGALNNTLASGKQRTDAEMAQTMAEIAGRKDVASSNRASVEKAADDARTDKERTDAIARKEKGLPMNIQDPKDPSKTISVRLNPATNNYERIKVDDDQAGTSYKPGTIPKPAVNPGQDPLALKAARTTAQDIINDLDQLLDEKGNLQPHTADAVGKSRILGNISEATGLGALTPSTTKGRAGINQLKGKLVLEAIGKLKRQSRTGATGFGQMNLKELATIENAASKLNATDMSDDDYKDELNRIRMALQKVMLDATGEDDSGGPPVSDAEKRAEEYMRRKGLM